MRSACLKFVPQPWWRVCAAVPRTAYRSACCAAADFRGSFSVDVMSVTCLFFLFFFLQFFGRLGELVDLQCYGLCEIFQSKAKSKGFEKLGQWCNVEDVTLVDSQSEFDNVEVSELSCASFVVDHRDFWSRRTIFLVSWVFFFEVLPR